MNLNSRDVIAARGQKVALDFVMLAVGLLITVSAVVMAGAIDEIEPRTATVRPSASQPQAAADPAGSAASPTRGDRIAYVAVSSHEVAEAMRLLVSRDGPAVAATFGEVWVVVASTNEQYEGVLDAVNLTNMELMDSGSTADLVDLRDHRR